MDLGGISPGRAQPLDVEARLLGGLDDHALLARDQSGRLGHLGGDVSRDHDGAVLWKTDLGEMQTKHGHGEGSSAALHGDALITAQKAGVIDELGEERVHPTIRVAGDMFRARYPELGQPIAGRE